MYLDRAQKDVFRGGVGVYKNRPSNSPASFFSFSQAGAPKLIVSQARRLATIEACFQSCGFSAWAIEGSSKFDPNLLESRADRAHREWKKQPIRKLRGGHPCGHLGGHSGGCPGPLWGSKNLQSDFGLSFRSLV